MRCLSLHATILTIGCFALAPDALAQEALSTFKDCDVCPEMVVIPGGSFVMGSRSREESLIEVDRHPVMGLYFFDNEGPQHRVTIRHPFAVGKYEVTFREWDACVADGGCNGYRPDDEGWGRGNRPAIHVSWEHAQTYLSWLSRKSGAEYRLLSEAEWEYAARAATTTPFHFGPTISTDQANFDGHYFIYGGGIFDSGSKGVDRRKTVPVGSFPSNAFGLHDVHGNVWEWVEDCYNDSYAGAPSNGDAWTAGECGKRVIRGGSFDVPSKYVRAAYRGSGGTIGRDYDGGFRVARTLP